MRRHPPLWMVLQGFHNPTQTLKGGYCYSLGHSNKVIAAIYEILHRHFPEHVFHWSELWEEWDDRYQLNLSDRFYKRAPGESERRAEFYRKLEEQFGNFKQAGTPEEFWMARKTFAGIQ